jgi:capsular exopolysaccharide synthesis family protein
MKNNKNKVSTKELTFKDILHILNQYKWSIITFTIISTLLSYTYLYFKPSLYNSYAILKVKPNVKAKSEDIIVNTTATINSKDVEEEISLLQTFKINNHALDKIHMKVQYYIDNQYKKIEIFKDIPIKIKNIHILDDEILRKKLTLIPYANGYSIQYTPSYKEKIQHAIFKTKLFSFDNNTIFPYNKPITSQYFNLTIDKLSPLHQPIYFVIHGDKRELFENVVKPRLNITQLQKDTSLIQINYLDTIPDRAQLYVNALITSFINYSINNKNKQNKKTLEFILKELESIKKDLKESEEQLEAYQVNQSIVKPSVQASLYIKKLSDIEIELSENKLKQRLVLNLINFVQNNSNLDAIAPSLSKLGDSSTLRLIAKLQDSQLIEEELTTEYTNEYPKLQSIRKQIQSIREKIEFNLKTLETNIEYQNNTLEERKSEYDDNLNILPSQERQLVNIRRNYEVKSKMYEYLLKKKSENKIIQMATFSDYQIIDHAYNSNVPLKTKASLILIFGGLLGFMLGSILAFMRHSKNRQIQNKEDVERLTSLPIYGIIPFYKHKKNEIQVHLEVKSPFTESFRTLRTNLQFSKQENDATTILITSTIAAEGKTTTSANLATIMEMARYKTIVINLDLRKPTLHKFFDIINDKGMSTYLNGDDEIEDIIHTTEFANLDIITSGRIPEDPSELILSPRLPALILYLKEIYDYIIIDSAPIGIVTDTKTIMKYSDLNLIILRENYAQKEFIATIEEMIEKHQFQNIGLILNASRAIGGEYGYGYSYEYEGKS